MKTILVVDDQPCIRKLLSKELAYEGWQVESKGSVHAALEYFKNALPSLVVLDLYLDDLDGFYLFQKIKSQYPLLPIVIFTAYDSYIDDPRLANASGYVIKSCDLDKLKQKIYRVLHPASIHPEKPFVKTCDQPHFSSDHLSCNI